MIQLHRHQLHDDALCYYILGSASAGTGAAEWKSYFWWVIAHPSLAADPSANPILGFDNFETGTVSVVRWRGDTNTWESFGPNIEGTSGPSIGLDAKKRIYLCSSGNQYLFLC